MAPGRELGPAHLFGIPLLMLTSPRASGKLLNLTCLLKWGKWLLLRVVGMSGRVKTSARFKVTVLCGAAGNQLLRVGLAKMSGMGSVVWEKHPSPAPRSSSICQGLLVNPGIHVRLFTSNNHTHLIRVPGAPTLCPRCCSYIFFTTCIHFVWQNLPSFYSSENRFQERTRLSQRHNESLVQT